MKRMSFVLVILVAALMMGRGAYAHHSFAATYLAKEETTVKGTVVQLLFRNPHSFVKIDVKDDKGQSAIWSLEWGSGTQLSQGHINRDTLKPGDQVVVTGNPGRVASEHRIRILKIERPSDGWKWEGVVQ